MTPLARIEDPEELTGRLTPQDRRVFDRLYKVSAGVGAVRPPATMEPWVRNQFGSLEAVLSQKIVKVTNVVTFEGAVFNSLRARRPIEATDPPDIQVILSGNGHDPLEHPTEMTPEDTFGRVQGKYCITASNIAKYDVHHGLVVFNDNHPLDFNREKVIDYLDTAERWAQEAHRRDSEAKCLLFMWNCLWRAGSTLMHGHAQMSLGRDMHYAKVEALRRAALAYRREHMASYFDDLYRTHEALGLGFQVGGLRVLSHLTPIKEKEVLLISDSLNGEVKDGIYTVLATFRDCLGVSSFNLAIHRPPLAATDEDWSGFPVIVRMVDRGHHGSRSSDFGAMELYAQSVIAVDPFAVARELHAAFAPARAS